MIRLAGLAKRIRFYQFALLATVAALLAAALLPVPSAMTTLVVRTEVLSYAPTNAALVPIILVNARIVDPKGAPGACLATVELSPAGSDPVAVDLSRDPASPGQLDIALTGTWSWSDEKGESGLRRGETYFRLERGAESCPAPPRIRLPVSGRMVAGSESGGSLKLLGGTVRVYGRSLDILNFLSFEPGGRANRSGTIYHASDMALPADARIGTSLRAGGDDGRAAEARWMGFADVALDDSQPGFDVQVATADPKVGIVMPGSSRTEPDKLSITLFAQLGGDPGMQRLAGILAILIGLLAIVAQRWPAPDGRS